LSARGFGLDTELTAKMLHAGVRPYEVPVTYYGRTRAEGKKITWRDGVECLRVLLTTKLRKPEQLPSLTSEKDGVVVPIHPHSVSYHRDFPEPQIANALT
jgi:hypothetical protein